MIPITLSWSIHTQPSQANSSPGLPNSLEQCVQTSLEVLGLATHLCPLYTYPFIYLSVYLFFCLFTNLSVHLYIYLSEYLSVCLSTYPSIYLSLWLSVNVRLYHLVAFMSCRHILQSIIVFWLFVNLLSLSLYLYLHVLASPSIYISRPLSLSTCLGLSLYLHVLASLSIYLSLPLYLSISVSLYVYLSPPSSHSLSLSCYLSHHLSLSLSTHLLLLILRMLMSNHLSEWVWNSSSTTPMLMLTDANTPHQL